MKCAWAVAIVNLGIGCASVDRHQDSWATESVLRAGAGDAGTPLPRSAPRVRTAAQAPRAILLRSELDALISRGLQPFVASIEVDALLANKRFVGWRVVRLPRAEQPTPIDVVEEDVVLRVNDLPVERPGDWVKIWDELRRAPELKLDIMRAGEVHVRRYPILRD